jgi:alkylhydroperoxidase/carboxymuconolactone decarboxylase family protein YurZ
MTPERLAELKAKYGAAAIDRGLELEPREFLRKLELRDALDPHYTRLWLQYGFAGLSRRPGLDDRTRLLVLIGQFAMRQDQPALRDAVRAALDVPVPAREILEVIVQSQLYGGTGATDPAIESLYAVFTERNVLEELIAGRLPVEGRDAERSRERESALWSAADKRDPRLAPLIDRHGWEALSVGLRLRPGHHLNIVEYFDALDPAFTTLWLDATYRGYYDRRILDDKTRLLCMVGDCIALKEEVQGRAHMAGAMRAGATPREIMEIIFMSSFYIGQPAKVNFLRVLVQLMGEQGRLGEIGDPPGPVR